MIKEKEKEKKKKEKEKEKRKRETRDHFCKVLVPQTIFYCVSALLLVVALTTT